MQRTVNGIKRQPKRIAGFPVLSDVNHYYIGSDRVTRGEALAAIRAELPEDVMFLSLILTLDASSPRMGVWTSKGLVHRVSSINGR